MKRFERNGKFRLFQNECVPLSNKLLSFSIVFLSIHMKWLYISLDVERIIFEMAIKFLNGIQER